MTLVAGFVYVAFSSKMEEKERGTEPDVAFPGNAFQRKDQKESDKVGPYQPPTAHV